MTKSDDAVEQANNTTWEMLNPDWRDFDGDLTDRFAKSQFESCPACGTIDNLGVYIIGEDCEVGAGCVPCRFMAEGDCPSEAIENWNTRAASIDRVAVVRDAFEKGRASVVFEPHSAYRDLLRQMICEGDFDFTKIFEEIEYEGETYADISNEGADALADYFIGLMEQIDERRSEEAESVRRNICDTCEQPYVVNPNYDRHDCGVAVIEEMKGK